MDNFKGFELFNDIEDEALRNRNRAVVMANIVENHSKDRKVNAQGASLALGYYNNVPNVDKVNVYKQFEEQMKLRHFIKVDAEKEKQFASN